MTRFRKRDGLHLALLTIIAVAMRLIFMAPYPSGWDDVDFALALDQYDLSRMQPHFPGYPIYVLAAQLFYGWLHEPFLALTVLSALAGGFTVIPLWLLFHKLGSAAVARVSVWLYTFAPLPMVLGIQPMSDSLGGFLAAWLAYYCWRGTEGAAGESSVGGTANDVERRQNARVVTWSIVLAGILLGLLLGVRVSYLALSALWLWAVFSILYRWQKVSLLQRIRTVSLSAGAFTLICLIWGIGLIVSTGGLDAFLKLAISFTSGHFSDWGGTYQGDSSFLERSSIFFLRQMGAAGIGTWWLGEGGWRWLISGLTLLGFLGLFIDLSVRRRRKGSHRCNGSHRISSRFQFLLVWIVPYLLWAYFAQNVEKPRHILPLLPPVLYLLVTGLSQLMETVVAKLAVTEEPLIRQRMKGLRVWALYAAGALWLISSLGISLPLLTEAHRIQSPMMQLACYVKTNVPSNDSLIFTWEEQRVLQYMSPMHTTIRLRKWEDFRAEVLLYPQPPSRIYTTNALVEGMDRDVKHLFREVTVFRGNPWLYPTYHTIVLYEGTASLYDELR